MQPCFCAMPLDVRLLLTLLCIYSSSHLLMISSQQDYLSPENLTECREDHPENSGYRCEPKLAACETLAYFRVQPGRFSSLATIAEQLFNMKSSDIAQASNLSTLSSPLRLVPGQGLYIPFSCACNGTAFSTHNVTYTFVAADTIVTVCNSSYEGLTTCQATRHANPDLIASGLDIGSSLTFPLRCACPSPEQTLKGIKFLVTYPIGSQPETISSVVDMFRLDETEFLLANRIENRSTVLFAATTVLLPFKEKPTLPPNASFGPPFPQPQQHRIMIHIIAASVTPVILILIILLAVFYTQKHRTKMAYKKTSFLQPNAVASPNMLPSDGKSPSIDLFQVMSELASDKRLIVFSSDDIDQATHGFSISTRINGSVYRGTIEGQSVAVKKMEEDATQEVQILQTLHHANIVSLLGVCLPSPCDSYLVYEYAEGGSLHNWLHGNAQSMPGLARGFKVLQWHDRLQIAFDVSCAMEYIHEHTNPRYVHNYINSSNILVDSNMRGKLANFSLAKVINGNEDLHVLMHRANYGLPTSALHRMDIGGFTLHEPVKGARVSPTVDVYAFGLVLLEILFEQESADGNVDAIQGLMNGHDPKEKLEVCMYSGFDSNVHNDCGYNLAMLAHSCVSPDPYARPNARTVAFTLSKVRNACLSDHGSF
ncbi:hypothetical protein GOP47_0007979 [Adiantum capillus-veneris]|uniref:Protein kinase domain-containing protein n=1 Tax=Adiantum capillus-veneris TaxID=13818 RepID=A0A9D4V2B0_ADICA|nr:hypothetical protein GOP47_0007979 [Adiantum capillus-veneris]